MPALSGNWVDLRCAFRPLVPQGRIDDLEIVRSRVLLQAGLVRADKLFKLHLVLVFDSHFLGEEELAGPDEVDVVCRFALPEDLLVANHRYLLHNVLAQPRVQPLQRPVRKEGQHFQEGVLNPLILDLNLLYEALIVGFDERVDNAVLRADRLACTIVGALPDQTPITEVLPVRVLYQGHEPLSVQHFLPLFLGDAR